MGKFLLSDSNLSKVVEQKDSAWSFKNLGKALVGRALDQSDLLVNTTGMLGFISGIYYGLLFEVRKAGYDVVKASDVVYVNPVNKPFYDLVISQKEQLEQKIKQGLIGISQSVADLELVEHDLRLYEEYEQYIDDLDSEDPKKVRDAEMHLKTIFVEQVDYHVGSQGQQSGPGRISMAFLRNNNIMPTIVDDFFAINSVDDFKSDSENKHIRFLPTVEKRMLEVKYMSYLKWLEMFKKSVKERVERLRSLHRSRKKTLEEYREWLKPNIVRHKLLSDAMEDSGFRKATKSGFFSTNTSFDSYSSIDVWVYKSITIPEIRPEARQKISEQGEFRMDHVGYSNPLHPFNYWTQNNLIYNYNEGLVADYPWITKEWAEKNAASIVNKFKEDPHKLYYIFIHINIGKANFKVGSHELEDGDFVLNGYVFSYNVMLAKLLEKAAKEEELEIYIDDMLGIKHEFPDKDDDGNQHLILEYVKEKGKYKITDECIEGLLKVKDYFSDHVNVSVLKESKNKLYTLKELEDKFPKSKFHYVERQKESKIRKKMEEWGFDFRFIRGAGGPYETTFRDRITKFYFVASGIAVSSVKDMILKRMNMP